jgi:hypothetical protein
MLLRQFIQSFLGLFFLVSSSLALSNTEFTYNVIDGGIEVTGCVDECPSDLVIPEEIDGFSVTSIGEYAFNEKQLTNVELPNNLTFIGYHAFAANQLTEITIPDSVTIINADAFEYNQLVTVIFGKNVTEIRGASFRSNNISGDIIIPSKVTMIRDFGFDDNQINRIYFYGDRPLLRYAALRRNSLTAVYYCSHTNGWPGDPIEGITPQLDENCGESNDHEEEHHGDDDHEEYEEEHHGEYCALHSDEHEEHEDDHGDDHGDEHGHDGNCYSALDLDQNGSFEALTDALILLRYAFGLRGDNLINGAIATDAIRTSAEDIEEHIQAILP